MRAEVRYQLIRGPYLPPHVEIGDWIECEVYGLKQVKSWSEGRIPWPSASLGKKKRLIIFGDLARAIRVESLIAVRHWWGVSRKTVSKWRKALNVPTTNEGTSRLHRNWIKENITPEQATLGRRIGNTPQKRAQVARRKREQGIFSRPPKIWTPEKIALLGTMPDRHLEKIIGVPFTEIGVWRRKFGIPAYDLQRSQSSLKGKSLIVLSARSLRTHRITLGVSQRIIAEKAGMTQPYYGRLERGILSRVRRPTLKRLATALQCHPEELIDNEAKPMGETLLPVTAKQKIVQKRRRKLQTNQRKWTVEEEALLGTMTDREVGEKIGCKDYVVRKRRLQLEIPSFKPYYGAGGTWRDGNWDIAEFSSATLKERRKEIRVKQRDIAKYCGVSISQYWLYENGGCTQMPLERLQKIAQMLQCDTVDLQNVDNNGKN